MNYLKNPSLEVCEYFKKYSETPGLKGCVFFEKKK